MKENHTYIQNYQQRQSTLDLQNNKLQIDKEMTLSLVNTMSNLLSPFHGEIIEPNAFLTSADMNGIIVQHNSTNIHSSYGNIIELPLIKFMSEYDGSSVPIYVSSYTVKKSGKIHITGIIAVQNVKQLLENLKLYIAEGDFITAYRYFNIFEKAILKLIKGEAITYGIKIRKALEPARIFAKSVPSYRINFSERSYQVICSKSQNISYNIVNETKRLFSINKHEEAIELLNNSLNNEDITANKKSDIYKILLDNYTKSEQFEEAIKINLEWINFCIANNLSSAKRLARMYNSLAKLQTSTSGHEDEALESLKMAMQFDPESKFYKSLYSYLNSQNKGLAQ